MKAPEDKGGLKIKCMQCDITLEVPFLRGILVDVPAEQAMAVVFGVSAPRSGSSPAIYAPKPGSGSGISQPRPSGTGTQTAATVAATAAAVRIDGWLREAGERKDANDYDGAIRLLERAYEEIKRENVMYPVEAFLRLPNYFQQSGRTREAWQEFNKLLFSGYPNQPKDGSRVMMDRARILEKMRHFLDRDGKSDIGAVYKTLGQVCEAISQSRDDRKREALSRLGKTQCQEMATELKKYTGNLGPLQDLRPILVEELGKWPDLDFERMGSRIDGVFAKAAQTS
jgi:hypothetical protein